PLSTRGRHPAASIERLYRPPSDRHAASRPSQGLQSASDRFERRSGPSTWAKHHTRSDEGFVLQIGITVTVHLTAPLRAPNLCTVTVVWRSLGYIAKKENRRSPTKWEVRARERKHTFRSSITNYRTRPNRTPIDAHGEGNCHESQVRKHSEIREERQC